MDIANRLAIVLLALLIIFAVAVVVLFTWAAAPESVERLSDFVGFLNDHAEDDGSRVILTLGAAVVSLLALVIVIVELTPPQAERVPVRDVRAGDALLSTDAIAQRLRQEISAVPHVTQTKATVSARGKGVEIDLELHVDPETNLALTSEEACRAVENLLTNRLSVEMARPPRLNLRYSELRLAGAPPGVPSSAPAAEPEETAAAEPPEEPATEAAEVEGTVPVAEAAAATIEGQEPASEEKPDETATEETQAQKEA
jgi:hypothetical protein